MIESSGFIVEVWVLEVRVFCVGVGVGVVVGVGVELLGCCFYGFGGGC